MATCTFFGHSNAPFEIKDNLKNILIELIEKQNVTLFYVGNHGNFDKIVKKELEKIKVAYSNIEFYIVCAYLPIKKDDYITYENYIFPEGFEKTPPKFAIINRNKWMIDKSDFVIVYLKNTLTNTNKFKEIAEKKGKNIILIK